MKLGVIKWSNAIKRPKFSKQMSRMIDVGEHNLSISKLEGHFSETDAFSFGTSKIEF